MKPTYLLDTHTLLWYLSGHRAISNSVKSIISDSSNTCFVSIGTLWEMAIKLNLGKLKLSFDFKKLGKILVDNDFNILQIEFSHIVELQGLEQIHKDPFDRLLIAQAKAEKLTVLSKDKNFPKYSKLKVVW